MLPTGTHLGDLTLDEVIVEYDGPQIFSCSNDSGQRFIALHIPPSADGDNWLFIPASRERISSVITRAISLRKAFSEPEHDLVHIVTYSAAGLASAKTMPAQSIPNSYLPNDAGNARPPTPVALDDTYKSALQLIRHAKDTGETDLDFSSLRDLTELPEEIADLTNLRKLSLALTQISNLQPLASLNQLEMLWLDHSEVFDLTPIAGLIALTELNFDRTKVRTLDPIIGLRNLRRLSLEGTQVSDLAPLANLTNLRNLELGETLATDITPISSLLALQSLSLGRTPVRDLAPLSGLNALQYLQIDGTQVMDLAPVAGIVRLQDAAVEDFEPFTEGFYYEGSPASKRMPFKEFVRLGQPATTVETINALRRLNGLPEHIPIGYEHSRYLASASPSEVGRDGDILLQKPASHRFAFHNGRIGARPQGRVPRHRDVASDIRIEIVEKARETRFRLSHSNAPRRVISTVNRLGASLGHSLVGVRAGILQMRFRSLEADIAAYDTDDGRKELPEDALAMLRDLASSVEDLMGCFPQLAEIEAERVAQRLKEVDVPQIIEALSRIRQVAEKSEAVAPSAIEALRAGEPELEHDIQIIESGASEPARIAALHARDRTVGYMLLVYRNFIAGAVKAGSDVVGLGAETWKDFRKKGPEQFANASVALVIATLVSALLGPTAAVGAFALSFKPLRDRATRVADKLASIAKNARKSVKDNKEE